MRSNLVFGENEAVSQWVAIQLGCRPSFFFPSKAIGVSVDGDLIAGVVYNNMRPDGIGSIEMSIASIDKRWATRHNLAVFFGYPFNQLRLERAEAHCAASAMGVRDFLLKLGFSQEGIHRKAHHNGEDAVSFAMLKQDCRWINGKKL